MRHLIEIGLTVAEWFEDKRGKLAAENESRELETKSILTFLSQGAVGGAIGYPLMVLCVLKFEPSNWSLAYLVILPILLVVGAVAGVVLAVFVWLASVLLKRRLGFVARAVIVAGVTTLLGVLLSYLLDLPPAEQPGLPLTAGLACVLVLPLVLMTGSRIRPGHLLFLGAGPRNARNNFGSWISYPAGFLLRVVNIFGLFETLLILALWIFAPEDSREFSAPERVAAIVLAVFYFPTSLYFSLKTPRKRLLLPAVIILNLPVAAWIVQLTKLATEASIFLSCLLLALIGLWAAYTFGCLIAPAPVQPAIKSWRETMAQRILPTNACQVQR
jgi:hypothetical protein